MEIERAREKFGDTYVGDDAKEHWRPNPNKIRGIVMRYARDKDEIVTGEQLHDVDVYLDDLWQWTKDKLGDGFEGVFQGDEMSPSGKFDRISKDRYGDFAEGLYDNNDEYRELIDDVWEYDESLEEHHVEETVDVDLDVDMKRHESIKVFYKGEMTVYPAFPDDHNEPDPEAYKKYMRLYAVNGEGIPSDEDEPSAEEFVRVWVDYLDNVVFASAGHICLDVKDGWSSGWPIPTYDEISEWARELWADDAEFRENVKEKWGDEREDSVDTEEQVSYDTMDKPNKGKSKKKRGQVKIGDFE